MALAPRLTESDERAIVETLRTLRRIGNEALGRQRIHPMDAVADGVIFANTDSARDAIVSTLAALSSWNDDPRASDLLERTPWTQD